LLNGLIWTDSVLSRHLVSHLQTMETMRIDQAVDRVIKAVFVEGESFQGGLAFTLEPAEYGSKDDPSIYQWTAGLIGTLSEPWNDVERATTLTVTDPTTERYTGC